MNYVNVFMDDRRTPMADNEEEVVPDKNWVIARTIDDTKTLLSAGVVCDLSLDHDMGLDKGTETGYDLVKWMEEFNVWPLGNIMVHSANIVGRQNMVAALIRNGKLHQT